MASLDSLSWFLDAPARVLGERHRWVSFALGVAVQLCAGTLYSVSAWGVALRDAAGWENDEDLSLATTVGTLGVYLAVHNGLALDRFGARPCLAFASIALLLGWNLLARVASSNGSPAAAAFALALVGQGSVTSFLASLAPNVANFEEAHQGKAHGVLLAGFGGSEQTRSPRAGAARCARRRGRPGLPPGTPCSSRPRPCTWSTAAAAARAPCRTPRCRTRAWRCRQRARRQPPPSWT